MRTRILKTIISSAALLALPLAVSAADFSAPGDHSPLPASSLPSTPDAASDRGIGLSPATPLGGIMVQNGAAYIIHRLQSDMSLPDGSRMHPDGTILGADGSSRSLSDGQMLTLDGQTAPAPFTGPSLGLGGNLSLGLSSDTGTTPGFNPGVPFGTKPDVGAGFPNTEGTPGDPGSFSGGTAPSAPAPPSPGDPTRDSEPTD